MLGNITPAEDDIEVSYNWSDEDIYDISAFALSNADDLNDQINSRKLPLAGN